MPVILGNSRLNFSLSIEFYSKKKPSASCDSRSSNVTDTPSIFGFMRRSPLLSRPALFVFWALCAMHTAIPARAQTPDPVSLVLVDGDMRTDWPDNGVVAFRRKNTKGAVTIGFSIGGTALRNLDYAVGSANTITIPDGSREAWLEFSPTDKPLSPASKTITVTLTSGYLASGNTNGGTVLGGSMTAAPSVTLSLSAGSAKPGKKAAVRFLNQAAFGPDGDFKNVAEVSELGFQGWIDKQFTQPVGTLQPYLLAQGTAVTSAMKPTAWWNQVMNASATADPLRQRVGFALSEIFVISDKAATLANRPVAMAGYYDILLKGAFGNFRDLLYSVGTNPCMGTYLSHLQNAKGNAAAGTFADENFAREIMQLFSIGLWQLNQDGSKVLDPAGQGIPTYDNKTVANMARVMTGFSFSGPKATGFYSAPENYLEPMRMWDAYHDLAAKTIIAGPGSAGTPLPARVASKPDTGAAGMADYNAAINALFQHPNTPPFFSKQLIQKLVTSNPSPQYVRRVADKFVDNGSKVRGDLKAVIKAVLLDPEARELKVTADPKFGKIKEPYLRSVNLARAFNAYSANQNYALGTLADIHFQQPMSAPSVFNFFRPDYSPAGVLFDSGLVAPEAQILNAVTALAIPNYYMNSMVNGFNRSVSKNPDEMVLPHLEAELALAGDVPALMRRLDLLLMGGTLPLAQHQLIREAVEGIATTVTHWQDERVRMAVYLIASSADFAVLR